MRLLLTLVLASAASVGVSTLAPASSAPSVTGATPRPAAYLQPEPVTLVAEPVRAYPARDANQGVGVDREHVYAVNNRSLTKIDRESGELLRQFTGDAQGEIQHMDSAVVVEGHLLYAAHSNWPEWPMESSVEVFDTRTMQHVDTHSFGIDRGSLTWLDRHDGYWWAGFANYDRVQRGMSRPYGETQNTQVVKLDDDFQVLEGYTIPMEILDRFRPMSNSGGSWGPDGNLWLTGHDLPEAYVMALPKAGSDLEWLATVELPGIEGQGIAWDRSGANKRDPHLFGIDRPTRSVKEFDVPFEDVPEPRAARWTVRSGEEITG